MSGIQDLLNDLRKFDQSPQSVGFDLRNDLAEIILRHLDGKNWTQSQLARAMGVKPPFITRLIHSSSNCTFDVAGRAFLALGVKVRLAEADATYGNVGCQVYKFDSAPRVEKMIYDQKETQNCSEATYTEQATVSGAPDVGYSDSSNTVPDSQPSFTAAVG